MLKPDNYRRRLLLLTSFTLLVMFALAILSTRQTAWAQNEAGPSAEPAPTVDGNVDGDAAVEPAEDLPEVEGINLFTLLLQGGVFMIPIFLMSLMTATFVIERFLGLRRAKVLPDELVQEIGSLGGAKGGFDPRKAYRICQQWPSAASSVIRSMLLKVGRPHSEVEHAVAEASDREAERLYANVRWLNLAAAVTPLMGLFGTVWGMICAFHDTTTLAPGQNKADYLAKGIYIALVTTLGGLAVAIPAAIFSHYFEGRVQTLFHQIDEMLFNLMPQIERYEGRVRFSRAMSENGGGGETTAEAPLAEASASTAPR